MERNKLVVSISLIVAINYLPTIEKIEGSEFTNESQIKQQLDSNRKLNDGKRKQTSAAQKNQLTEDEQRAFEKIGCALDSPKVFKSEKQAINYLRILMKGDYSSIRAYQRELEINQGIEAAAKGKVSQYTQKVAKEWYEGDMQIAISRISLSTREGLELIEKVLKLKKEYPNAAAQAAKVLKSSRNITLLREASESPVPYVRLEAAGSLLALGDADKALPVLDELTQSEGYVQAMHYLFKEKGRIINERGLAIIEKALDSSKAEVRISAAKLLFECNKISRKKLEEIALVVVSELKNKSIKDYGLAGVEIDKLTPTANKYLNVDKAMESFFSDSRSCDIAISIISQTNSGQLFTTILNDQSNSKEWMIVCKKY